MTKPTELAQAVFDLAANQYWPTNFLKGSQ